MPNSYELIGGIAIPPAMVEQDSCRYEYNSHFSVRYLCSRSEEEERCKENRQDNARFHPVGAANHTAAMGRLPACCGASISLVVKLRRG